MPPRRALCAATLRIPRRALPLHAYLLCAFVATRGRRRAARRAVNITCATLLPALLLLCISAVTHYCCLPAAVRARGAARRWFFISSSKSCTPYIYFAFHERDPLHYSASFSIAIVIIISSIMSLSDGSSLSACSYILVLLIAYSLLTFFCTRLLLPVVTVVNKNFLINISVAHHPSIFWHCAPAWQPAR